MKKEKKNNRVFTTGFTLVETLVVVGIMMLLTASLIAYSRSSGKQITLNTEQAKLIGILNRAKSLALQRDDAEKTCAFGVRFNGASSYEIVRVPNEQVKGEVYKECDSSKAESYGESYIIASPIVISNSPEQITFEGPYIKVLEGSKTVILEISGSSPLMKAEIEVSASGGISKK